MLTLHGAVWGDKSIVIQMIVWSEFMVNWRDPTASVCVTHENIFFKPIFFLFPMFLVYQNLFFVVP